MRPIAATLVLLAIACGCKNQTAPITNPFLTADRVPPPATRMPAPGTAAPYYPGDPLAGAVTSPPAMIGAPAAISPPATTFAPGPATAMPPAGSYQPTTLAPSTVPPATGYPGATTPAYPVNTTAPVSPPGGWGAYPPQSTTTPSVNTTMPAQLQTREVTPAEFVVAAPPVTPTPSATLSSTGDGFRPQGSAPRTTSGDTPSPVSQFRSPGVAGAASDASNSTAKFAAGENYDWLRGQLEYWPENGQWTMRYLEASQADAHGGRVLIDNPQVLGNLPPGEFVMVKGQLFGRQVDDEHYVPSYRVAVVQRQKL